MCANFANGTSINASVRTEKPGLTQIVGAEDSVPSGVDVRIWQMTDVHISGTVVGGR